MKNSPLQLEDYLISDLQFAILLDLAEVPKSQDYDVLSLEVDSETKMRGGNPRKWRSKVTVESKAEEGKVYPYSFRIEYTGFFTVADEFPEEFVEQMVKANAPAVLYSSAREALMYLTGRGRLRAVLLPSVSFLEPPKKPAKTSRKKLHGKAKQLSVSRKK